MPLISTYAYRRFSLSAQAKGASMQRQNEAVAKWLEAKARCNPKEGPYVLDTKLKLDDLGVSAFRGKNATEGALSAFLKAVDRGDVKRGSYLLVENIDRLSREQVTIALGLFLSIIGKGVTIVTLVDGQEYSQATLQSNPYPLIMSIISMIRANEESATKSGRVADAWKRKRQAAIESGKALTKQCPAWLTVEGELDDKGRKYVPIKERVEIVQWMFAKMAAGWGQGRVAADLTRRKVTPWGSGRKKPRGMRWHDSYIALIANNRAVLGQLQLHTGDGKSRRQPVGEPIQGFYPAIISVELFAKVQNVRLSRKVKGFVGRQGPTISNLFQGLIYDIHSKERCVFISHSKTHRWQYLTPPAKEKDQRGWNYHAFEAMFLSHCRLLNWAEIFEGSDQEAVASAEHNLEVARAELIRINALVERYADAVATAPDVKALIGKLRSLEEERVRAQSALSLANDAFGVAVAQREAIETDAARIKLLASGELDSVDARLSLREEIRRVVRRIDCSFSRRGGHYALLNYSNGATRYLRPTKNGGVKILDSRESGFVGTPSEWNLGAGNLSEDAG